MIKKQTSPLPPRRGALRDLVRDIRLHPLDWAVDFCAVASAGVLWVVLFFL